MGAKNSCNTYAHPVGTSDKHLNALSTCGIYLRTKNSLKKGKNSKKCSFRAFLEPPESPQGSHGSQKQLQYTLAPSRYLRQTFECIKYMWDPFKNQKRPQKRQKWQKCSFRANMGHDPEILGYFLPHNPILWVEIHIIPV